MLFASPSFLTASVSLGVVDGCHCITPNLAYASWPMAHDSWLHSSIIFAFDVLGQRQWSRLWVPLVPPFLRGPEKKDGKIRRKDLSDLSDLSEEDAERDESRA